MSKSLEDLYNLLQKVDKNGEEIKADINIIKDDLKNTSEKLETKVGNLEAENQILKKRIIACERKLKKNNIIIYGLDTQDSPVLDTVIKFIKDKLNIELKLSDIDDCYQLKNNASQSIVLLGLIAHLKKSEIFKNLSKLKNTGVSFADDLPFEDRQERKLLNIHLKKAKANNIQAKIIRNKIIIEGVTHTLSDLTAQTSQIPLSSEDETADTHEKQHPRFISSKKDKKKTNQSEAAPVNKIYTRNQQIKK